MARKWVYLVLCVLGLALPYSQFVPWVLVNGFNLRYFLQQLLANRISVFFGLDVLVSAIVLLGFVRSEGKRLAMRWRWLPVVATLGVGVSLGLPLFLYMRELALESKSSLQAV